MKDLRDEELGQLVSKHTVPVIVGALGLTLVVWLQAIAQVQPPNIAIILTDDLSVAEMDAAIAGGWMPNLQAHVINRGTMFSNAFVTHATCCPSRATILTGKYTHNHNVLTNEHKVETNEPPIGGFAAFNDSSTLATWLEAAGYRTGLVGKYLNNYPAGSIYIPPGWSEFRALSGAAIGMYNYQMNNNGGSQTWGSEPADYQTDVFSGMAQAFIAGSEPWFLYVAPTAPHTDHGPICMLNRGSGRTVYPAPRHLGLASGVPLPQPPSYNEADFTDKPTWLKTNYPLLTAAHTTCLTQIFRDKVASMMAVDDMIGAVAATLTATGQYATTAIIVTSDNGYILGEHRFNGKEVAYEGSIRVPLYITAPGHTNQQTSAAFVLNNDFAPTILTLAGVAIPSTVDGRPLVPVLANPGALPWRNQFLVEYRTISVLPRFNAIRTAPTSVQAPSMKWVRYYNESRELYDLAVDPYELVSQHLSDVPPYNTRRAYLNALLTQLTTCAGAGCRTLEDQ